jgi:uncharacterized membrane protein
LEYTVPDGPELPADDRRGLERIVFFSDAVFAIAITLLALDIRLPDAAPHELATALLAVWPKCVGYVISFLIVGVYWMGHHRAFRYITRYDEWLIWLNFLLLLVIAFLPFPTSLIGEYPLQPLVVAFYAVVLALAGLLATALWLYAARGYRLVDARLDPQLIRQFTLRPLSTSMVFLLSVPIAFVDPLWAMLSWASVLFIRPLLARL